MNTAHVNNMGMGTVCAKVNERVMLYQYNCMMYINIIATCISPPVLVDNDNVQLNYEHGGTC